MSYNPNIPQPTDLILQSAKQIKANFTAIGKAFSENHVPLNQDPSISGMHNIATLIPNADPTTSATQMALYSKLVSSVPALFLRPNNNQTPIQMTYPSIKADGSVTQYSFMAGPFIVYGGLIKNPAFNQLVTLTPGSNLIYVDLTETNFNGSLGLVTMAVPVNITGTSFNIQFQNFLGSLDVYYFAIGL